MRKFLLTLLFTLLAVPAVSFAAFDDVTLTTDVIINVAGINLNISGSSAVIESITVNADNFSFILLSGSSIQVTSPDRRVLSTNAASQYIVTNTCSSSESVLKHSSSVSGSVTITITPQSATCTIAATSASAGGGEPLPGTFDKPTGSFSVVVNGGAAVTKIKEVTLVLKAGSNIKSMAISSHKADLSDAVLVDYQPNTTLDLCSKLGGLVKLPQNECIEGLYTVYVRFYTGHGQPSEIFSDTIEYRKSGIATLSPEVVGRSSVAIFPRTLRLGSTGNDVKLLQQLLNTNGIILVVTGAGSPGNETSYFGLVTEKAVQKFQTQYGIISYGSPETTGYGVLGPKTRAKLAEVFAKATPTAPEATKPSPVAVPASPLFTIGLSKGMTHPDVKRLQQLLNSNPDTQIVESGVGSPGNETEYFGSLTEKAVQKFQKKHNVAKEDDPWYGYVGPKTRAKLNELSNR